MPAHFPAWLAPVQAVVMNITDAQADYVEEVAQTLANQGFRVEADLRNEKIGYKIREHTLQKRAVPPGGRRPREGEWRSCRAHAQRAKTWEHVRRRLRRAFAVGERASR